MSTTPMNVGVVDGNNGAAFPTLPQVTERADAVSSSGGNMIAVPCANCHLLVMLCKSSPSCPNCKYVQPLAPAMPQAAHRRLNAAVKPLETLSLLHQEGRKPADLLGRTDGCRKYTLIMSRKAFPKVQFRYWKGYVSPSKISIADHCLLSKRKFRVLSSSLTAEQFLNLPHEKSGQSETIA